MLKEFDPVKLSLEENQFVYDHVGEPPVVAFRTPPPPPITDAAVRPIIEGTYELLELEKHGYNNQPFQWAGVAVIRDAITAYLTQARKWAANKGRKGAPRFPSMYSYDARGRAFWSGTGSDSGQVRTYFNAKGERVPFAVLLVTDGIEAWTPDWLPAASPRRTLTVNEGLHRLECFCGHTESFKEGSRASQAGARGRMSKHMRRATTDVDDHRELHTAEFS